ncbi:MAG: radical SAM protein [Caldithrix sp.]|nr:radical SAM protein [Caldithrix sp.]
MDILLTHSYFINEDELEKKVMKPYPPLGLLYLSAYLKEQNFDVRVYDTTFSSYDRLIGYLEQTRPPVLGIHCNMMTKFNVMKIIRYCKTHSITSILGGPDASTQVEEFLNYGADVVISGEGEEPLTETLIRLQATDKHHLHEISNVSFKDAEGQIIQNSPQHSRRPLDTYPNPDREAIDLERYLFTWEKHHGQRPVSLITARGCAFTCKWCSHSVYGWTHRRRKPEYVVSEIKHIIERYNPTHLWFADDVFTVNKRWLRKFHQLMVDESIRLPFECIARADKLDEELVTLLKSLGCYRIWFGAESGSQRILDAMARGVTKRQISDATRWCQKHGIEAGYFVMFGYPGENIEDVYETIEFVSKEQPDRYLTTIAYPLRGTTMYNEIKDQIKSNGDWETQYQREMDLKNRFPKQLYHYAIKKLASDFRLRQPNNGNKQIFRRLAHQTRSGYCRLRMKQLQHIRT